MQNIGTGKQAHIAAGFFAETLSKIWQERSCQTIVPIPGNCRGLWSQPYASCSLWGGLVLSPSARETPTGSLWQEWITAMAFPGIHSCSSAVFLWTGCFISRLLHQAHSIHVPQEAWLGKRLPHNTAHVRLWDSKRQLLGYIYTSVYIYTHTQRHTHIYIYTDTHTHIHIYVC